MKYEPGTYGVEGADGAFVPIIHGGWALPAKRGRTFTTVADNQTRLEIHVLRGRSDRADENISLGKFDFTDIPPAPKGVPQIEVSFEIDVNGIVSVSAQDQATGRSQSMVIHPSGGLSQDEVSRLVEETRGQELEERSHKDLEAVVRQLDGLVANTMRSGQALEGKLSEEEQHRILEAIEKAKRALRRSSASGERGGETATPESDALDWLVLLRHRGRAYRSRLVGLDAIRARLLTRASVAIGDECILGIPVPAKGTKLVVRSVVIERLTPSPPLFSGHKFPELNGPKEAPALIVAKFSYRGPDAISVDLPRTPEPPAPRRAAVRDEDT